MRDHPVFKQLSHVVPNLVLAGGVLLLVVADLLFLALLLVVLSKWQMFLGRPKFWLNNIRANGCDLLVAFSVVVILGIFTEPHLRYVVTVLWVGWLLGLKPLSKPGAVALQASICQLLVLAVIFLFEHLLPGVVLLALIYGTSYIAAEHFFTVHEEPGASLLKATWGLVAAQMGWVLSRWAVIYPLLDGRLAIPQAALIITLVGYVFGSMYLDHTRKLLRRRRLLGYIVLLGGLLLVVLVGTNWDVRI